MALPAGSPYITVEDGEGEIPAISTSLDSKTSTLRKRSRCTRAEQKCEDVIYSYYMYSVPDKYNYCAQGCGNGALAFKCLSVPQEFELGESRNICTIDLCIKEVSVFYSDQCP